MRKLVVVGMAAVAVLLGQAFLAGEADAAKKKKTVKPTLSDMTISKSKDTSSPKLRTGKPGQNPKPSKPPASGSSKRH